MNQPDSLRPEFDGAALRPRSLKEFAGQASLKDKLNIALAAAKLRRQPLSHVLLKGPPGLGKTTLATIIANEMDANYVSTTGPALRSPDDVLGLVNFAKDNAIIFIDECHDMKPHAQDTLHEIMEPTASANKSRRRVTTPTRCTIVGATTRPGSLQPPFRARFRFQFQLEYYEVEDLIDLILADEAKLHMTLTTEAREEIARRSRGTPRHAVDLLTHVADEALVKELTVIEKSTVEIVADRQGIDKCGLTTDDRKFLKTIIDQWRGKPAGLVSISFAMGEDHRNIEEVLEPFLCRDGWLIRSSRGRLVTEKALLHIYPDAQFVTE